ncbi:MAG: histidine phosphatase family protein [Spirochaetaceae bacterium]
MRLYIVRHADPDYLENTITVHGHAESAALGRRLEWEGITRLYSSPVNRALHTAEYAARRLGVRPMILPWAEELRGLWVPHEARGRIPAWDIAAERLLEPEVAGAHAQDLAYPEFAGLPITEAVDRIRLHSDRFLGDLGYRREGHRYRVESANTERVAVICHGGFGMTWMALLLQIPFAVAWAGFWLAPSSVTTVLFDQRSPQYAVPRCLSVSDISHLYESGYAPRPRGIVANFD